MSEFFIFLRQLDSNEYQRVFLVDPNASDVIDLNKQNHSDVEKYVSRSTRFRKFNETFNRLDFFHIAKNIPPAEPTHHDMKSKQRARIDSIYHNEINLKFLLNVQCTPFSDHDLLYAYELVGDNYGQSLRKWNDFILSNEEQVLNILEFHDINDNSAYAVHVVQTSQHVCEPLYVICAPVKKRYRRKYEDLSVKISTSKQKVQNNNFRHDTVESEFLLLELKALCFERIGNQMKIVEVFYIKVKKAFRNCSKTSAVKVTNKMCEIKSEKGGDILTDIIPRLNEYHGFYLKNS